MKSFNIFHFLSLSAVFLFCFFVKVPISRLHPPRISCHRPIPKKIHRRRSTAAKRRFLRRYFSPLLFFVCLYFVRICFCLCQSVFFLMFVFVLFFWFLGHREKSCWVMLSFTLGIQNCAGSILSPKACEYGPM